NDPPTLTADDFTMGDSYVTGNYTGDVAKIGLKVNGTLLQLINATTSPYQYYAKGKITAITDIVSFITYDANGNQLKEVPVNVKGASTLKANDFTMGDSYVTGTYTGAVARVALKVNGTLLPEINVSGSSYQYNAKDKIKAATDTVSLISYDARGIQLKEVPVTVKAVPITVATDDFTVGVDSYVTGTYTGDLSRIAL
ncbi:autolysin modifier protein, partial [Listeria seeligeri]|nr:autolysin modifier protein [Listeria seeligeri]